MSSRMKKAFMGMAVTTCAAGLMVFPASIAQAHDGTPPNACQYDKRANTAWARACYESRGDDHWLQDRSSNGRAVRMHVMTDYNKHRWFTNSHGAPAWHEKKLDHREKNCVRWRIHELERDGDGVARSGPWSHWYSTSTGKRC